MRIDLHCHTTASDGVSTPAELVAHAVDREVDIIAVTDHDTVAGVAEAIRAAESARVRVVAGIELSTSMGDRDIHLLGYFVDVADPGLAAMAASMRERRLARGVETVRRLNELGFEISFQDVLAQAGDAVVGRPHVARALVASGAVPSLRAAFSRDLLGDGGPAHVAKEQPSTVEGIALVRAAGGCAVVAHPGVGHHDGAPDPLSADRIAELAEAGLAGLEVHHPDHSPLMVERLREIAQELGLVPTGGSDWHGPEHSLGNWPTDPDAFARLEARARAGG